MKCHLVIVANDAYVQHASVMLASLYSTNPDKIFDVYFLTDGVAEENHRGLEGQCKEYSWGLKIIIPDNIDGLGLKELPVGCWTTMMYYKLLIPQLLPENVERCIFLDVDVIVNDDISELFELALQNSHGKDLPIIYACEDVPPCEKRKELLGLPSESVYINSGVMICNLTEWRKMERVHSIIQYAKDNAYRITNEQDVIALYFQNRIALLPIRWNMVTFYFYRKPLIYEKYLSQLKGAKQHPAIIHFCSPIKPWFRDCDHPYGKLYKKYIKLTPFKNYVFPYYKQMSIFKYIKKCIYRIYMHMINHPGELVK